MVGFALIAGIMVVGVSMWQTTVIPAENENAEFNHYLEVQEDFDDLRAAHQQVTTSGEGRSPSFQLGATYSTRSVGVNPPEPDGTLTSTTLGNISIDGAKQQDANATIATRDVCGVDQPETHAIRYEPDYNRLQRDETPPIVYENTVVYREAASGDRMIESGQFLVQGSNINLVPVQSNVDRTGQSTTVSLSGEGYEVEQDLAADAAPNVTIATNISASTWETELLAAQIRNGYVNNVTDVANGVRIDLGETPGELPWTVRCDITTDSQVSTVPRELETPPTVRNGGFGVGGITEHAPTTNREKITQPRGIWTDVSSISAVNIEDTKSTAVPSGNYIGNSGEGIAVDLQFTDGTSDTVVYMKIGVVGSPGSWKTKKVWLGHSPNNYQSKTLTKEAAKGILGDSAVDLISRTSYKTTNSSFSTQDGNFGAYLEDIKAVQDGTIQVTGLQGRPQLFVPSNDLEVSFVDGDTEQSVFKNNVSKINFTVNVSGRTSRAQNLDLQVRDSQGQQLDNIPDRVARQTIENMTGGTKQVALTWENLNWNALSTGTEYQIVAEADGSQDYATVEVLSQDTVFTDVNIVNTSSPIEYPDRLNVTVEVENVGLKNATQQQISLNLDGNDLSLNSQPSLDVPIGESKTATVSYDTGKLNPSTAWGADELKATVSSGDSDRQSVQIAQPTIITSPTVDDIEAGKANQTQNISFTLGESLSAGNDKIKITLSDASPSIEYDTASKNWTVVNSDGSISVNTNNNNVKNIVYQVGQEPDAGKTITIQAKAVDATASSTDTQFTVDYRVSSANNYAGQSNGDTNSTTYRAR